MEDKSGKSSATMANFVELERKFTMEDWKMKEFPRFSDGQSFLAEEEYKSEGVEKRKISLKAPKELDVSQSELTTSVLPPEPAAPPPTPVPAVALKSGKEAKVAVELPAKDYDRTSNVRHPDNISYFETARYKRESNRELRISAMMESVQVDSRVSILPPAQVPWRPFQYVYDLTPQQKTDLLQAYKFLDTHAERLISMDDVRVALRALGFEPTKKELRGLIAEVDVDNTIMLSYNEFLELMKHKMFETDSLEELKRSYAMMSCGSPITLEKLRKIARELGEPVNDEQLKEMLAVADPTGKGSVDETAFITYIETNRFEQKY